MKDNTTTLSELKKLYAAFVKERNWERHHDPKSVAASISIEANELLELFQWETAESARARIKDPEWRDKVKGEVADVFIYLINFANQAEVDLSEVFEEKLKKARIKFPPEKVNKDLVDYHKIKAEYRKTGKS